MLKTLKKKSFVWTKVKVDLFYSVVNDFIEFDKRLCEIAEKNKIPYEEIWLCWKEQTKTAGITIKEIRC